MAKPKRREDVTLQRRLKRQDPGQGIVKDERGQEQPVDKQRAQQATIDVQREAAQNEPPYPGEPAKGE